MRQPKYSEEQRQQCIALRRHRWPYKEIAKMVGCSLAFVTRSCAEIIEANRQHRIGVFAREEKVRTYNAWKQARETSEMLAVARPDGSRCKAKACAFPALVNGLCRVHFLDSRSVSSIQGSPLALAL